MFTFLTIISWAIAFCVLGYLGLALKELIILNLNMHKLPGPPSGGFLFGNGINCLTSPDKLFRLGRQWAKEYYPAFKIWVAYVPTLNVLSPEDFEIVLSTPVHSKKSLLYRLLHGWLGTGLLTSQDEKWHTRRKILTPAFHFNILRQFVPAFTEHARWLVDSLKKECHTPVDVSWLIKEYTLKSIAETAMGAQLEFKTKIELDYQKAITEIMESVLFRAFRPWFYFDFSYRFTSYSRKERKLIDTLHKFTEGVIKERQKNFDLSSTISQDEDDHEIYSKRRLAMMDLMLSEKILRGTIDDHGIREEVDTFMFEGHDTTAMAIIFGLMELACHENVQESIVQEMTEVLGDIRKEPSCYDLQKLNYLERCIKEILRLYPSVPFISRELGEDIVTASGYKISRGSIVNLHIYDLHHNPDIYPDPEKFDPDRFLPENCQNRHPFAYLPFSAGPRNCIGQKFAILELKAVFCAILANFVLEPVDTASTIVLLVDLVLRTKEGIKVKFVPRA